MKWTAEPFRWRHGFSPHTCKIGKLARPQDVQVLREEIYTEGSNLCPDILELEGA